MLSHFVSLTNQINDACTYGVLNESEVLTGFSGKKLIGTLQRFSNYLVNEDNCYLEVGVFQGLTLLSVAMSIQRGEAYGIDNFAYFDKDSKNFSIVKDRIARLKLTNANIINMDYEDALEGLNDHIKGRKVSVYFVDGPHDYRSQLMCLELGKHYLADNAVVIIDDCNYNHVRQANRDFLVAHPEFKLLYQAYTNAHPGNMTPEEKKDAEEGWWDGVNILVKDPENLLTPIYPPCRRDKTLFENESTLHSLKYPYAYMNNLGLIQRIEGWKRKISSKKATNEIEGKFKRLNTYSSDLTKGELNPSAESLLKKAIQQ
ncbi:class I SAM-dependent methyltransferase [Foetidibacter luteolus]|uniref:class I SAM-dependent methyltransferase n=1 Tax=Foetidibacter luteolus TaxID=2608880 RepID=UPI00129A1ABB|nr:class I SAM-dependent methyltransferase [Foetidibacter luteolus]